MDRIWLVVKPAWHGGGVIYMAYTDQNKARQYKETEPNSAMIQVDLYG